MLLCQKESRVNFLQKHATKRPLRFLFFLLFLPPALPPPRTTHHAPRTTTAASHSHTTRALAYYTTLRLAHAPHGSSMRCVLMVQCVVRTRVLACSRGGIRVCACVGWRNNRKQQKKTFPNLARRESAKHRRTKAVFFPAPDDGRKSGCFTWRCWRAGGRFPVWCTAGGLMTSFFSHNRRSVFFSFFFLKCCVL